MVYARTLHDLSSDSLVTNEHGYLDIPYYRNRFGYISLSPIKSREKVGRYITKYISKDIALCKGKLNAHMFYSSHGLAGKELLHECYVVSAPTGAYENEYTFSSWFEGLDEALNSVDSDV